jgi:spore germination protein GerM
VTRPARVPQVTGRRRGRLCALGAVGVVAVLGAGCAIPTQSGPVAIAPSRVPFGLLNPHASTTTTLPKAPSLVPVKVFFLNASANNQLTPADRVVATSPAPLTAILTDLIAGPSNLEQNGGLTTAIPSDVTVLSATANGSIVTVNFNSAFGDITGTNTEQAVAQVVATVANANGFGTGVIFQIEGVHTAVPIANGSQVSGPVYLLEFLGGAAP